MTMDNCYLLCSCVHLTNASIQKKDPLYKSEDNKELQVRSRIETHVFPFEWFLQYGSSTSRFSL